MMFKLTLITMISVLIIGVVVRILEEAEKPKGEDENRELK
jgi:hypothetical protein